MQVALGCITYHVLRVPADASRWNLVTEFLQLRKQVFVDRMGWELATLDLMEFEQYDSFAATYVIAEHRATGRVAGGARLLRTDHASPSCSGSIKYSYMIRDAGLGLLPGLPAGLCAGCPPVDPKVWELTRLVSDGTPRVAENLLRVVNAYLASKDATRCLFLGPAAFLRMARGMGFRPEPLGQVVGNASGRFLAFACDVIAPDIPLPGAAQAPTSGNKGHIPNIGRPIGFHLSESTGDIVATTYRWSATGEEETVWHEHSVPGTCRPAASGDLEVAAE